jgi:hypothetical protein
MNKKGGNSFASPEQSGQAAPEDRQRLNSPSRDPCAVEPRPRRPAAKPATSKEQPTFRDPDQIRAPSFAEEITLFTRQIESLASSLPLVMPLVTETAKKARRDFVDYVKPLAEKGETSAGKTTFQLTADQVQRFERLKRNFESADQAVRLIPRSFLASLVSQFDSFIGRLVRLVLFAKPEILNSSERTLLFSDLVQFDSVDKAREFLIEKEVESVIRQSHADHFAWFERKLKIPLREGLEAWAPFIELTERRNLFVHCDGVVSSQYLAMCHQHGASLSSGCQLGAKLDVSQEYFASAFECVYEVGVKLAQVLWRKLVPTDLQAADANLNGVCFELLVNGNYNLAIKLLDFATVTLKKHADELRSQMFVINRAQAYKWSGASEKCLSILDEEDWSASSDKFRLSVSVLRDDFITAARLIKRLINTPDFSDSAYKDWPLFKEFRKSPEFLKAYEDAYKRPFRIEEVAPNKKLAQEIAEGPNSQTASESVTH